MRARFCTQCQVSFRAKNLGFPNTMVSDFEYFVVIWMWYKDKIQKKEETSTWMYFSLKNILGFIAELSCPTNVDHSGHPRDIKKTKIRFQKKRMHETLSYSPFGCHFNRERVPGIVVLPLFFVLSSFWSNLSTSTLQLENLQTGNTGPLYPPEGTRQGKYALFCFPLNQFSLWVTCNSFSMKLIHK